MSASLIRPRRLAPANLARCSPSEPVPENEHAHAGLSAQQWPHTARRASWMMPARVRGTIYEQLRRMGHVERLDVFLYSRGGAIDVPWRIATALRTAADEWNMLIPFRANSAATLLGLGADEIILGRQGGKEN